MTQEQAAAELGWSVSTLRRRLDGGRDRLRERLTRRLGVVPAGLLAGGAVLDGAAVAVSPALAGATCESAVAFAAGVSTGTSASLLATGELAMMTRMKLATVAGAMVVVAGLGAGVGAVWPAAHADDPKPAAVRKPDQPPPAKAGEDRIRPGDRLRIMFPSGDLTEPPATGVIVEPSGKVPLGGWNGRVKVDGLTPEEAEAAIVDHLRKANGKEGGWAQVVRWGQFPADPVAPGIGLLGDRVRKLEEEVAELKKAAGR